MHLHPTRSPHTMLSAYKTILLLVFILCFPILGSAQQKQALILTFHKGGTHLIDRALDYLGAPHYIMKFHEIDPFISNPDAFASARRVNCVMQHISSEFNQLACRNDFNWETIICIRDPRDAIISAVYWMDWIYGHLGSSHPKWGPFVLSDFVTWPMEKKINAMLRLTEKESNLAIQPMVHNALYWMQNPDTHIIRFEDLVGEKGGGSQTAQENTMLELMDYLGSSSDLKRKYLLGLPLTEEKENASLFGGTPTFRKGQIGSWKEHFTDANKQLFKELLGEELILLGYEADDQW